MRRLMVSALTLLSLSEDFPQYASYPDLAALIRGQFYHPGQTLRELYNRITFNILVGNTDDHARNHAAFWDGRQFDTRRLLSVPARTIRARSHTSHAYH